MNKVADYLSRSPLPFQGSRECEWDEYNVAIMDDYGEFTTYGKDNVVGREEWIDAYKNDNVLFEVMEYVRCGSPCKNKVDKNYMKWWEFRDELMINDDDFIIRGVKIVRPEVLREKIIELTHEGHLGIVKSKKE
ncbi:hypothetical protein NDU88_000637 [Pleurodeles waltl]|uniref:Uncharacterized protein n=1 Tax=Pleurodeles waltl TaxID=8319 RepID=A0AAV7TGB0_PLEWA|nr:hypothetical protein NDU88_000637 [Pleurodeles waltl]